MSGLCQGMQDFLSIMQDLCWGKIDSIVVGWGLNCFTIRDGTHIPHTVGQILKHDHQENPSCMLFQWNFLVFSKEVIIMPVLGVLWRWNETWHSWNTWHIVNPQICINANLSPFLYICVYICAPSHFVSKVSLWCKIASIHKQKIQCNIHIICLKSSLPVINT